MLKPLCLILVSVFSRTVNAADLTAQEVRWLKAAAPVLAYSRQLDLPIDVTVQPQAGPNDVALAMGFTGGRCKLVLSLRGNSSADAVFDGIPDADRDLLIETMAAHEIGHCWRYARRAWHALPAGFTAQGTPQGEEADTRREEAYADLAALAWTRLRHGNRYAEVHKWMSGLRASAALSGGSHDTRAWLRLAARPDRFGAVSEPFADVAALWREGVAEGN